MDKNSWLGFFLAIGAVGGGHVGAGGHMADLMKPLEAWIVLGGTFAAALTQYSPREFMKAMKDVKGVYFSADPPTQAVIDKIVSLSTKARREGMLALERELATVEDDFMKRALEMAADGIPMDQIRHTLELEIYVFEHEGNVSKKAWEAMGGYAPTVGIIGAVLGLIHVMKNLSDPSKLGAGIAVAFVATIYGVGFANLYFIPWGNKIGSRVAERVMMMELVKEGVCSIAAGENPLLTERKLNCFAHEHGGGKGGGGEAPKDIAAAG